MKAKELLSKFSDSSRIVGFKRGGIYIDLLTDIDNTDGIEPIYETSEDYYEFVRHTTAHIMAQAIQRLYGGKVKLGIGPTVENGFYYDIDMDAKLSDDDLPKIEEEMKNIIKEDLELQREIVSKRDALELFSSLGQDYKVELINEIEEDMVSVYKQGEFIDLCRGPHVERTGLVPLDSFKLTSVAGAYWRGDERNKMLQRVYGVLFRTKEELERYIWQLEEAKKRDHRKLGKELKLFMFFDESPAIPFWLPNGMFIKNTLISYMRNLLYKNGYVEIQTPMIMRRELWERSGHWQNYRENMYVAFAGDEEFNGEPDWAVKPMSCPGSILVFKSEVRSYRDLPLKFLEFGNVHRYERAGVLHGLLRVRGFTQDDAHIFLTPQQIKSETINVIRLVDVVYKKFDFEYAVELSTKPEKYIGTDEMWEVSTKGLREALDEVGVKYEIREGEGAFYGPKIDFHLKDAIGRTHQCGTIQLDMALPERFDVNYIGEDGKPHRVVMIHRAIYGSLERFIGILIEHYAGKFPLWFAPIQVIILPVSEKFVGYGIKVKELLESEGFRVKIDIDNEKLGFKIRRAQNEKIPYMLIVGQKEQEEETVSVRSRDKGEIGSRRMSEFINMLNQELSCQ
ncbi:MAG: threonine--tRNA ligase [Brevinematales bacterium]|nr:threonine--tRNA ligase [Brevinematales bacterium]